MLRRIENSELAAADIPDASASWEAVARFALSFDGYGVFGSVANLAALVKERRDETLDDLRGRLFFLQRAGAHLGGGGPNGGRAEFDDLLDQIRRRVAGG